MLQERGQLTQIGGPGYIAQLFNEHPSAGMALEYAANVKAAATKRSIMQILTQGPNRLRDAEGEQVQEELAAHVADLEPFLEDSTGKGEIEFERWGDGLEDHVTRYESDKPPAVAITGFTDLDSLIRIKPSQLIIVAARPAMGKSAFALSVARANAVDGTPVLFASMEMGREEIADRVIAAQARVEHRHLDKGKDFITDDDWARIAKHVPDVAGAPLYMDYRARQTPSRLRARIRYLTRVHGRPPFTVVDYLGLMQPEPGERINNQYERVTYLSRELKLIAQETGAPNRGPEQRENKIPTMSDLRDSGAIEQDANVIILLHREDYYDRESARAGEADLIVAKNRSGPQGVTITAAAQLHYARYSDMAST
jgi:replicative DNA helicase